jgi:hypothetical protein
MVTRYVNASRWLVINTNVIRCLLKIYEQNNWRLSRWILSKIHGHGFRKIKDLVLIYNNPGLGFRVK